VAGSVEELNLSLMRLSIPFIGIFRLFDYHIIASSFIKIIEKFRLRLL